MIFAIVLLLLLSAGSLFSTALIKTKYEEILPVSAFGYIFIIYLFGLFGGLLTGVKISIFIAIALVIIAVIITALKQDKLDAFKNLAKLTFTPAFFIFWIIALILTAMLNGLLAYSPDEFSHWMYIVKIMNIFDMYGTADCVNAWNSYPSYPPGMAVFQYFVEKIYLFFNQDESFCEWVVYWAYQILFIAAALPLFSANKLEKKKAGSILRIIIVICIILFIPLNFFDSVYHEVYIDPFMGLLTGFLISNVVIKANEDKNIAYSLYIWLGTILLVLSKDVGFMLGLFVAALYMLDYLAIHGFKNWNKQAIINLLLTVLSVIIPKYSWKLKLIKSETLIRWETHIDLKALMDVILGKDDSYRTDVYNNYNKALFERSLKLGNTNIEINTFALVVLLIAGLSYLLTYLKKKKLISKSQKIIYMACIISMLIIYVAGMCVIYMFNFSEAEAVGIVCSSRYLNIVFLATTLPVMFLAVYALEAKDNALIMKAFKNNSNPDRVINSATSLWFMFVMVLLLSPLIHMQKELSGENKNIASEQRAMTAELSDKIARNTEADDLIHIVYQMGGGDQNSVLNDFRYGGRPGRVCASYSIGEPFFEGDEWTIPITCEEWQNEYLSGIDYLGIWYANDYFFEHFAAAFEDPSQIQNNCLYAVNHDDGLLYLVE